MVYFQTRGAPILLDMYRKPRTLTWRTAVVGFVLLCLGSVLAIASVTVFPQQLLQATGINSDDLEPADALSAIRDARAAAISVAAGITGFTVAIAALWQANGARITRDNQLAIRWSDSLGEATNRIESPLATSRLSGVASLVALGSTGSREERNLTRTLLATFLRGLAYSQENDSAVVFALTAIQDSKDKTPVSLAGSNFTGLDLRAIRFGNWDLSRVTFRDATLHESQRSAVESAQGADASGVRYVAG